MEIPSRLTFRKASYYLTYNAVAMSTIEEVNAAQRRMNDADAALRRYTERPVGAETNIQLHRGLADALKQATDEYVALVADLRP